MKRFELFFAVFLAAFAMLNNYIMVDGGFNCEPMHAFTWVFIFNLIAILYSLRLMFKS